MANQGRYLRIPPDLDKWLFEESTRLSKERGKTVTLQTVILEIVKERYSSTLSVEKGQAWELR